MYGAEISGDLYLRFSVLQLAHCLPLPPNIDQDLDITLETRVSGC